MEQEEDMKVHRLEPLDILDKTLHRLEPLDTLDRIPQHSYTLALDRSSYCNLELDGDKE